MLGAKAGLDDLFQFLTPHIFRTQNQKYLKSRKPISAYQT